MTSDNSTLKVLPVVSKLLQALFCLCPETKRQPRLLDKKIHEMSTEELDAFIERNRPDSKLLPIDVATNKGERNDK